MLRKQGESFAAAEGRATRMYGGSGAAGAEEAGEEGAAFFGEEAAGDFDAVVQAGVVEDGEDGAAGAGFGVGGGEDEAADAGVEDGSGAHGAGLEGGVEVAGFEAIVLPRARPAARRATISAWAVGSESRRTRLWPRARMSP